MVKLVFRWLFLVALCSLGTLAQTVLDFRPIDVGYDWYLDRLIAVSASPNLLHVYDPETGADQTVSLPGRPISLSTLGGRALVSFEGRIAVVDLSARAISRIYAVNGRPSSLLAGPEASYFEVDDLAYSISMRTGEVFAWGAGYRDYLKGVARIPSGATMYGQQGDRFYQLKAPDIFTGLGASVSTVRTSDCGVGAYPLRNTERVVTPCGLIIQTSSGRPEADLRPLGTLDGLDRIADVAVPTTAGWFAALPSQITDGSQSGQSLDKVYLFDLARLNPVGTLQVPAFPSSGTTVRSLPRRLFFDSRGKKLYVLLQADSPSGIVRDYAIQTYDLDTNNFVSGPSCTHVVEPASPVSVPWEGGMITIRVTAAANCVYPAATLDPRLVIVPYAGLYSGNMELPIHVRANTGTISRRAVFLVGRLNIEVQQAGRPPTAPAQWRVGYPVDDAKKIGSTGRVALLSGLLRELHVVDPVSGVDSALSLYERPRSFDLSADGKKAVVGQDGRISIVDLDTMTLERSYPISTSLSELRVVNNFAFGRADWRFGGTWSIHLGTGAFDQTSQLPWRFTAPPPGGRYLYAPGSGGFMKWDVSSGGLVEVPLPASQSTCTNLWFSSVGGRALSDCGEILKSDGASSEDLALVKRLPALADAGWRLTSADHTTGGGFAVGGETQGNSPERALFLVQEESGFVSAKRALPGVTIGDTAYFSHSPQAFWRPGGGLTLLTRLSGGAPLLNNMLITVIPPQTGSDGCPVGLGSAEMQIAAAGGDGSVVATAGAECAWRVTTASPGLRVTSGSLGFGTSPVSFNVAPNYSQVGITHTIQIGDAVFTVRQAGAAANAAPAIVSSGPATVSGTTALLDLTIRDADGATNLSRIYFQIGGSTVIAANGCHGFYDRAANVVTLYSDTLSGLLAPVTVGTVGVVGNSQCAVSGAESSATASGVELVLRLAVTLKGSYLSMPQKVYFWATDQQGSGTGWVPVSQWTPPRANAAPTVSTTTPATIPASAGVVNVTVRDQDGVGDIQRIYFLVNGSPTIPQNGCHGFYERRTNELYLFDDTLTSLSSPLRPGGTGSIRNGQCRLEGAGSRVIQSDATSLTLELVIYLTGNLASGSRRMYYWPVDAAGQGTGWVAGTSWSGSIAKGPPSVVSGLPTAASALTQRFQFKVRDPDGYSNIFRVYFLINPTLTIPTNTCHGFYEPSTNRLGLYGDGLSSFQVVQPRVGATLTNSQCSIATDSFAIYLPSQESTEFGIGMTITLKGILASGTQKVALWVQDVDGNGTGWQETGTWTVRSNAAPEIVSIAPLVSTAQTTTFSTTVRDADGANTIFRVYFQIGTTEALTPNGCIGFYEHRTGTLYLDEGPNSLPKGPVRAGLASDVVENGQCRLTGAGFSAVQGSSDLQLTVTVTLLGSFSTGTRYAYFAGVDDLSASAGWRQGTKITLDGTNGPVAPVINGFYGPSVSGSSATVGVTVADSNGLADIDRIYFLLAPTPTITVPYCHGFYERATNRIYLYHSELPVLQSGYVTPGEFMSTVSSAECRILGEQTSVAVVGENLTLLMRTGRTKTGPTNFYWWVTDRSGLGTGWVKGSSWN